MTAPQPSPTPTALEEGAVRSTSKVEFMSLPMPTPKGFGRGLRVKSPDLRRYAMSATATMPSRIADLKPAPAFAGTGEIVRHSVDTYNAYDGYFLVTRTADEPGDSLVIALAKTINDVITTAAFGHDLSQEEEADLLDGLRIMMEIANGQ